MSNRLANETSPYLLQHKDNPVDWYPWCDEAFERAKEEGKPIFLSIGYSACHWCHVIAHESFEDSETANILNKYYICIKVDKEERPDIDSVYMEVCQAFTGSGGWPTSIFMTHDQKPFFAGTYFPKTSQGGMIGFRDLILALHDKWQTDRKMLLEQSEELIAHLNSPEVHKGSADRELLHRAAEMYAKIYDSKYGGFGRAPKFPAPHNILFLLSYYERYKDEEYLQMAEHTLTQMYRGGLFDHIGGGFCRYSTDRRFLVPHFEKMLYDNALLIIAYCRAHSVTENGLYLEIAQRTADYILGEMTSPEGAFYSLQDADSDGEEGKYYLFTPSETIELLGREGGERFNIRFDITEHGYFDGKNIPNLLGSDTEDHSAESFLTKLDDYRKKRASLHRDDKILCSWNALTVAAMCELYLSTGEDTYLRAAKRADDFIFENLYEDGKLFVSYRNGKRGVCGFLDDYAACAYANLALFRATSNKSHLVRARELCDKVLDDFSDSTGGFYLYSKDSEELILRPKQTYDGAIPSGNSFMAYNLVKLSQITSDEKYTDEAERILDFIAKNADTYPTGHAMFLCALAEYEMPALKVIISAADTDRENELLSFPAETVVFFSDPSDEEYPLLDGKTTYYACKGHRCLAPTCDKNEILFNYAY